MPGESTYQSGVDQASTSVFLRKLRNRVTDEINRATRCVAAYWSRMKRAYGERHKDVVLTPGTEVLVELTEVERAKFPFRKLSPKRSSTAVVGSVNKSGKVIRVKKADGSVGTYNMDKVLPLKQAVWGVEFPTAAELDAEERKRSL